MNKFCDTLSETPESPINQACENWAETKAAYPYFGNDNADAEQILSVYRDKTIDRSSKEDTILFIKIHRLFL